MALKSTVYKAELQISEMDQNYYNTHALTLALHPSETEERMMIRLLAFACNPSDSISFGRGLSDEEDAALWDKDLTDHITLWIDVGLPDEKRVKKASHRADRVIVYAYGERTAPVWWQQNQKKFAQINNLEVYLVNPQGSEDLVQLCQRTMSLYFSVMDGQMTMGNDKYSLEIQMEKLQ